MIEEIGEKKRRIEIGKEVIEMRYENKLYMVEDDGDEEMI